ncbi:K+ transport system, NAD-binding component [Halobacteroides halobius DSM 5150]|uniref:K+ transport system, NAD-binding component n=1 Tax=Halobacteroides halobius (strain ATCC 35273 / DSM 5150 / MD-1) TaxID=748449 RepID=L0K9K7_HALHC|nr:TrkA family potassium uptake protein [Halobacteroides halobius]AGB41977.1 K+ transport system, NAD-binding component [Halobacteroides halobius DSM 5150]
MRQFIVVGLGRFGTSVATTLANKEHDVLAIDIDEEKVQEISNQVTHAVQADATSEETLQKLGVDEFDIAIVAIGSNIHGNILATLVLKELGVSHVVVKAQDNLHGKLLSKVGADKVVYPERDMGARVANNLVSANVLDYIELAPNYSIAELIASDKLTGKSLKELDLRSKFGVNVLAIKSNDDVNVSPEAEAVINANDVLVVMGQEKGLSQLKHY